MASKLYWCFTGPRLFRAYKTQQSEGHNYGANILESFPDRIIQTLHAAYGVVYWTSPFIGILLYRRGYFSQEGFSNLLRVSISLVFVYTISKAMRGCGRLANVDFRNFIHTLVEARASQTQANMRALAGYDFEFWAWPVGFKWDEGQSLKKRFQKMASKNARSFEDVDDNLLTRTLGYIAMHTFGKWIVYPGSTPILNYVLSAMLNSGRATLVEEKNGFRSKLLSEDSNEIDTMFVDRRTDNNSAQANTLVITSEGNAGFYEIGCSGTPLEKGYSVLMWNHPGFGGSTGCPVPDQEQRAIDVVMQYAIYRLGFLPENIALFAWSIGGYSASWAAKAYPDIKFVVLDATFDHLQPLALAKMPVLLKNIVVSSVARQMNLNIAEQLIEYNGPVLLIRRTRDEMICTQVPNDSMPVISSNRGNFLLLKLLQYRYPTIVDESTLPLMKEFLAMETFRQMTMLNDKVVIPSECNELFTAHVNEHGLSFPMKINVPPTNFGKVKEALALFLITVHMENYESSHCTPLPIEFLHKPWIPGA